MRAWATAAVVSVVLLSAPTGLRADVVYLEGGGKVVGKVLSAAGGSVRIRSVAGTLTIPASRVVRIEYGPTPREEFARRAAALDRSDTAAMMALADWCARRGLDEEERELLEAVLALEPDHAEARRRLGFVRVGGRWLTRRQAMQARGLVEYRGRWITPAERDALQRADLEKRIRARWQRTILRAARLLERGNRQTRRRALEELNGITDPLAVGPLVAVIARCDEPRVRTALVGVLRRFAAGDPPQAAALDALVDIALLDDDPDVRQAALDILVEVDDPRIPAEFVRALEQDSWTLKLRASYALGELKAFEAVPHLIRNLTAIEGYRREVSWSWRRGGFSHGSVQTYIPAYRTRIVDGRIIVREPIVERLETGTSLGGPPGGRRVREVRVRPVRSFNTEAWRALVKISGKDFGYYADSWLKWYESERRRRRRAVGGK